MYLQRDDLSDGLSAHGALSVGVHYDLGTVDAGAHMLARLGQRTLVSRETDDALLRVCIIVSPCIQAIGFL